MHASSMEKMGWFVSEYLHQFRNFNLEIVDVGSQEIVGDKITSYRNLFSSTSWHYQGLDLIAGPNVDVVISDPFSWEMISDNSLDLVVSGQVFEHVDFFWISTFEIARILRPGGVAVIIAPSAGPEHRFPLDCWRFYVDGFKSLAAYVGFDVLDAHTDWGRSVWADSMLVMQKPLWGIDEHLRFNRRLAHQKAVLSDVFIEPVAMFSLPEPSPLSVLTGNRLREQFAKRARVPLGERVVAVIKILLGPAVLSSLRYKIRSFGSWFRRSRDSCPNK